MKRILVLIPSLGFGGAERVTVNLANEWVRLGHQVVVVTLASTTSDAYALDSRVWRLGLNLHQSSANTLVGLWRNLQRIRAVYRIIRKARPHLAIGMMPTAAILLILASRGVFRPMRIIVEEHIHPPEDPLSFFWNYLRWLCYPLADRVVMLVKPSFQWLREKIPRARGAIIPNPLVFPLPIQEPVILPENLGLQDRQFILGVGRFTQQKGFDILIQAFAKAHVQFQEWRLVILGDGPLRSEYQKLIQNLRLEQAVFMPGHVGNVATWYEKASIFVLCSRFEGFPNVLIEAMAYGCAVIATDCPTGPSDIITHGKNGLLVPVGDVNALARALVDLMSDDKYRSQLAMHSRSVRYKYDITAIAQRWLHI